MEAFQMELEASGHKGTSDARRPIGPNLHMDCIEEALEDTEEEDGERRPRQQRSDPCGLVEVPEDPGDRDEDILQSGRDWEEVDSPWTEDS